MYSVFIILKSMLYDVFNKNKLHECPIGHQNPETCPCSSCHEARRFAESDAALKRAIAKNFAPTGSLIPAKRAVYKEEVRKETPKEKIERQRKERYQERDKEWEQIKRSLSQQAYDLTEKEWSDDLQNQAREYQWDTSQQENVSIAVLTVAEANEYLDLLIKDTHGELSRGKDYTGVGMGLKGAYEVSKELGGWGATAKAVDINGTMNIVIEKYKPRYLDLGVRWKEATPKMLKIGYALNTVQGNISFLRGNIYVEIVFSGAVNTVDYILHDEKTLGEVLGQLSADFVKGAVAGVAAQGVLLASRAAVGVLFGFSLPAAIGLGLFAYSAFKIGGYISDLDDKYEFTKPMKEKVESLID